MSANSAVAVRTEEVEERPSLRTQREAVRWFPMKPLELILLRHVQAKERGSRAGARKRVCPSAPSNGPAKGSHRLGPRRRDCVRWDCTPQ
jgi:hypothetical protein